MNGKIACLPALDGAAFTSVTETLYSLKLISSNCSSVAQEFFSRKSCYGTRKSKYCSINYAGDNGSFHCLKEHGDVAFMNLETFKNLTGLSA